MKFALRHTKKNIFGNPRKETYNGAGGCECRRNTHVKTTSQAFRSGRFNIVSADFEGLESVLMCVGERGGLCLSLRPLTSDTPLYYSVWDICLPYISLSLHPPASLENFWQLFYIPEKIGVTISLGLGKISLCLSNLISLMGVFVTLPYFIIFLV